MAKKSKNVFGEIRIETGGCMDRIKLNGKMDTELKKIIQKYNIPKERLYCIGIPIVFGWYWIGIVLGAVQLYHGY